MNVRCIVAVALVCATAYADEPPIPALPAEGHVLALVPAHLLPVGEEALAAYLISSDRGKPASEVELHITANGARVRALRWIRPGIARVEVVVPAWRSSVELVVRGAISTHVSIPVDPGPPEKIELTVPPLIAGQPFALRATVTTRNGVQLPNVRVEAEGCATSCPHAGPVTLRVAALVDDAWQTVDTRAAIVAAAPVPVTVTRDPWQWVAAARGGGDTANGRRAGASALIARELGAVTGELGVGWDYRGARYAETAPVVSSLALVEHAIELVAGARYQRDWFAVRVLAGPALVHQGAEIGMTSSASWGVRATARATVGARVPIAGYLLGADLGARASADVVAPAWRDPRVDMFVEVSLAGAL